MALTYPSFSPTPYIPVSNTDINIPPFPWGNQLCVSKCVCMCVYVCMFNTLCSRVYEPREGGLRQTTLFLGNRKEETLKINKLIKYRLTKAEGLRPDSGERRCPICSCST